MLSSTSLLLETTVIFFTDEDVSAVDTSKDTSSAESVDASLDAARDEDFAVAEDFGSFYTAKDDTSNYTTKNFSPDKYLGSNGGISDAKDATSVEGMSDSIDAATAKYFAYSKEFASAKGAASFDNVKNLAAAEDSGSANDSAAAKYACSSKGVSYSVDDVEVVFAIFFTPRTVRV